MASKFRSLSFKYIDKSGFSAPAGVAVKTAVVVAVFLLGGGWISALASAAPSQQAAPSTGSEAEFAPGSAASPGRPRPVLENANASAPGGMGRIAPISTGSSSKAAKAEEDGDLILSFSSLFPGSEDGFLM
jgi:hypothetical protein